MTTDKILKALTCKIKGHNPFKKEGEIGFPSESYCLRCDLILFGKQEAGFFYNGKRIKYHKELSL